MPRQSLVKTKSFYVTTELAEVKRNYVVTECFCVATEFGQDQEFLCQDRVFMCRERVWPWMWFLCHDRVFSRHDRVFPRQEILGHDKVFSYRDRAWGHGPREFTSRHNVLCHDSGARHCVAARLRARDRHALSK